MKILTITLNPVLDKNTEAKLVLPQKKIRCSSPGHAPGGGGINVSRAIKKLGGTSLCYYLGGGENGDNISGLLKKEEIDHVQVNSGNDTRENLMVLDTTTNNLYRFGMPGPEISEKHWKNVIHEIKKVSPKPHFLVASGSLPPGVPDDFYARLAVHANKNNIKMVLDTSGPPLQLAIEEGLYLVKPNLREMASLMGKEAVTAMEYEQAALDILEKKSCDILVLSLGAKGAMMARQSDIIEYITPPTMPVVSPVGAGDSMVAGIVLGFSNGLWPAEAVRYGVAAGTAAAMTPGSELCRKEDTDKINEWLSP